MSTVGILGVIHDNELRKLPDSWEKYKTDSTHRGYWGEPPSEYWDLIFPLCEELKYDFVPIDWVELDVWLDFDPFKNYSELQRSALNAESEQWFQRQLSTWNSSAIPFNSLEYDNITKQKYTWLEQINPESHVFRWECRHLIMIQRIKNAINKHLGKRVLCIVGADHNHAIYEGLAKKKDIQLVYPLK